MTLITNMKMKILLKNPTSPKQLNNAYSKLQRFCCKNQENGEKRFKNPLFILLQVCNHRLWKLLLKGRDVLIDCKTHWNSLLKMLHHFYMMRKGIKIAMF